MSASFTPTSLTNGSTYQVSFSSGITDLNGNPLIVPPPFNFTVDTQAPVISSITPANNSTNVSTEVGIVITFNENIAMNQNTFTPNNLVLTDSNGNVIAANINYGLYPYKTLTITPADNLAFNMQYTLTLKNITDAAGNPLSSSASYPLVNGVYTMTFTTQGASEATYSIIPAYLTSQVVPNVLIILDNSNSMDLDMDQNAIGSYNCTNPNDQNTCSRSVLGRLALTNLIKTYASKMNIGLMTYALPGDVSRYNLHNNFYFVSYDPHNYCPNPVSSDNINHCNNYCVNEDPQIPGTYTPSADEAACNSTCQSQNPLFMANYWPFGTSGTNPDGTFPGLWPGREPITTTNGTGGTPGTAIGSSNRQSYCALIYPKTYSNVDPATQTTVYHAMQGTFYDPGNWGTEFAYAPPGSYNTLGWPQAYSSYNIYGSFFGTSDGPAAYSAQNGWGWGFEPTTDDEALGFYNFGERNYWYWTSQCYFTYSAVTPFAGGYLNVPVASNDSSNTQLTALLTELGTAGSTAWLPPVKPYNDMNDYMSCSNLSQPNQCPFVINAGWEPTEGTLMSAVQYFNSKNNAPFNQGNNSYPTPIQYRCQKNFIIYVTDGLPSTTSTGSFLDSNGFPLPATELMPNVLTQLNTLRCPSNPTGPNCGVTQTFNGTPYNFDVKTFVLGLGVIPQAQSLLNEMAVAGGEDNNGQAYYAKDATSLSNDLITIFQNILLQTSSGTAASLLNNSQGSGANILQGVFYPQKSFDINAQGNPTQANWIGEIQSLWYYLDPYFTNSSIREDTNKDYELELNQDNLVTFLFNTSQNQTLVNTTHDVNGNGSNLVAVATGESPDLINGLWRAGSGLWNRNIKDPSTAATYDPRNIYTVLAPAPTPSAPVISGVSLTPFSSASSANFSNNSLAQQYLQVSSQASANTLIDYINGIDQAGFRSRTVTKQNCGLTDAEGCNREWKLSDIIDSTPKVVSTVNLNSYGLYPPSGYGDSSYNSFVNSNNYQNRGMAFSGGNDGMLHAFRLGILDVSPQTTVSGGQTYVNPLIKGRMMYPNGTTASYATSELGREEWAFIPMDSLPYLGYLGATNYSHVFYVDGTPTPVDVSINAPAQDNSANCALGYWNCQKMTNYLPSSTNLDMSNTSWRTVLIEGMGLGGATRNSTDTCIDGTSAGTCIKTPVNGVGYSSYFALDITNPDTLPPASGAIKFLWEFSGQGQLGSTLSGPAIVRIGSAGKNGRWFAVFGSGPTGPIDTTAHTFYGKSDQNLKLFVVDIGTGQLAATIDTQVPNAFAGTLATAVIDVDKNNSSSPSFYSDDAIYVGYVQQDTSAGTWTKGGVLRVYTKNNLDPTQWQVNPLIQNIGPVTTTVAKLQDPNATYGTGSGAIGKLWIYFGTGRYFYSSDDLTPSTPFRLYGIIDPCYSNNTGYPNFTPTGPTNAFDTTCGTTVAESQLTDQTGSITAGPAASLSSSSKGWLVSLASSETYNGTSFNAERVISNPVASPAGTVFFTTFLPTADVCGFGGESYLWALNYNSGAAPIPATMQGNILIQVSSGVTQQVSLSTAFSNSANLGYNLRRMFVPLTGVPPTGTSMTPTLNPPPTKRILHIQEQ
jgi:type IV pilus assembly protein PilY1